MKAPPCMTPTKAVSLKALGLRGRPVAGSRASRRIPAGRLRRAANMKALLSMMPSLLGTQEYPQMKGRIASTKTGR